MTTIQGLIFDFDGLILDTEGPIFQTWNELYQQYGRQLSREWWGTVIGSAEAVFDPGGELERQIDAEIDWTTIEPSRRQHEEDLILQQPVLPGVADLLRQADEHGLKIALASSSSCGWVTGHLERLGLIQYFDAIVASDDVQRTKPDPELFISALAAVDLRPEQAIVFEDSPNGILAAKRAGIFTVVVPNGLTQDLSLELADLHFNSLADTTLDELLELVEKQRSQP